MSAMKLTADKYLANFDHFAVTFFTCEVLNGTQPALVKVVKVAVSMQRSMEQEPELDPKDALRHSFWLMAVALLWGATNPLMKKGSAGIESINCSNRYLQFIMEIKFLALKWQYVLPFLLNQSGSVLYYFTLSQVDISLAVPITNSLTFLVTTLVGRLMGEKIHSSWTYLGIMLVLCGVVLCVLSKVT